MVFNALYNFLRRDSLRGDSHIYKVDRVFGHYNILLSDLENLGNRTRVLLFALHEQLLIILLDANKRSLLKRTSPVVHKHRLILNDRKFRGV